MTIHTINVSATIHAPIGRCFLLSTNVALVRETLGMRLIDGVTEGHIIADSRVVWRGWKFGLPTTHHTRITGYESPRPASHLSDLYAETAGQPVAWFQDSQERGRFASFAHDHYFREFQNGNGEPQTLLEDVIRFSLPFGFPGRMVAKSIVAPHIRALAMKRFALLKRLAESDGWKQYLNDGERHGDGI